jgi:hypothetical protein
LHEKNGSGEIFEGRGFGFEGGDGFDEAGDSEGVANAALTADEAEDAAFAGKLDGDAHERGNAGAVNLGNAIEDDDDFLGAGLNDGLQGVVELVGGLTDGEAAVNVEDGDPAGLADVDLHGDAVGHGFGAIHRTGVATAIRGPNGIIRWRANCTNESVVGVVGQFEL